MHLSSIEKFQYHDKNEKDVWFYYVLRRIYFLNHRITARSTRGQTESPKRDGV